MGSLKVTLCTGLVVAFTALGPAAHAADGGGLSVNPASPAPGGDVALRMTGCSEKTASAVSAAFVSDVKLTVTDGEGTLVGESRVRSSLEIGAYDVTVTCGDARHTVSMPVGHTPSTPASPVAPVKAGGGGSAVDLAAEDAEGSGGPGTTHAVVGLLLASAAATAVALRSARRRRGTA
ncbi:hypothetical protein [Streptomyces sp. NPDC048002]|uniref:hypothetical protein n=1 Tax=Streptomyces sp. NPDC048002 TaxID=3154344 RepID=UPI0033C62165